MPTGTAVAVACLVLTAVSPFAAFALTLESVALAVQKMVPAGGDGGGSGEGQQPPYAVRSAVRLGE